MGTGLGMEVGRRRGRGGRLGVDAVCVYVCAGAPGLGRLREGYLLHVFIIIHLAEIMYHGTDSPVLVLVHCHQGLPWLAIAEDPPRGRGADFDIGTSPYLAVRGQTYIVLCFFFAKKIK